MAFYNFTDFQNISESRTFSATQSAINDAKRYITFDIFLSHSFLDRQIVKGIFLDLTKKGYKVYVDWIVDPHLDRSNVTKESAELIRNRMKNSKSLVLAISANAEGSKWMPWELGFVDGNTNKCAILPVYENRYNNPSFYEGYEYLKLYPYIKKDDYNDQKLWVAENPTKYVSFEDFLKLNLKPSSKNTRI